MSGAAACNFIKSNNLKLGDKVSYDHLMSKESDFLANNYGCVLKKVKVNCGTIMVD